MIGKRKSAVRMRSLFILLSFLSVLSIEKSHAQKIIKGKVSDENNKGIENVMVVHDNIADTVYTDETGNYKITVDEEIKELKFYKKGFEKASSLIGFETNIDINMVPEGADMIFDLSLMDLLNMQVTSVSKKAERLQDVPSSIYVISSEDIKRGGSKSLFGILRDNVPGFWGMPNDYRNADGFIRNTTESSFAILLDGTPITELTTLRFAYENFDIPLELIDRIEVIKGSGGIIYGANSASGVISIITKDPSKQSKLIADATFATPGEASFDFIGTPIKSDKLNASIYGGYSYFTGFEQMDVIKKETSVVPRTHVDGETTITSRFTGDDNTYQMMTAGFGLNYQPIDKLNLSTKVHISKTIRQAYFHLMPREKGYFVYRSAEEGVRPFAGDSVVLDDANSFRLAGNIQADYSFSDSHNMFFRISTNREDHTYVMNGGFNANNAIYDFEIQDNFKLAINEVSVGANYRILDYDINIFDRSHIAYIDPDANESLMGAFIQDKLSFFDDKLNLFLGIKVENHSVFSDKYFTSPMAKFSIILSENLTIWGGYLKSWTTPAYDQTNIEFTLFRAYASKLYPFYYPSVSQVVRTSVYNTYISGGADEATANAAADAYIASAEGLATIDAAVNGTLAAQYPSGNYTIATVNAGRKDPTSFENFELGARYRINDNIYLETNFFYANVKDAIGSAPVQGGVRVSPTRGGNDSINAWYYGNYIKGYNMGLESILKWQAMQNLNIEVSHSYFYYELENQENEDYEIDNLTEEQLNWLKEPGYPSIPENVFRTKIYYNITDEWSINLSAMYATQFFTKFTILTPDYSYEYQRFDPLYQDYGNQELIGAKFDSRFVMNFKINKKLLNKKLDVYLYGKDIFSGLLVEGANQLETVYPRQVGSMFGLGLNYNIK